MLKRLVCCMGFVTVLLAAQPAFAQEVNQTDLQSYYSDVAVSITDCQIGEGSFKIGSDEKAMDMFSKENIEFLHQ